LQNLFIVGKIMRLKVFFNIFFQFLIFFSFTLEGRELSIKQLEERNQADKERERKREKRGKKEFSKEIIFSTDIIFITKERKIPPVLSNLDPILEDEGFYGVKLAVEDNLTTGRFVGHGYKAKFHRVSLDESLKLEFEKLLNDGYKYFVADLNSSELKEILKISEGKEIAIFNVRSKDNSLREIDCNKNLFHVSPSYSMLADAITQYLVKKKWKKWFLISGPEENDKKFSLALKESAEKFNIKIKEDRKWDFSADLRRTAQKEVPIFTKGVKYDVLVVSDEKGEFGEYLPYRTWSPNLVVGTQGLVPMSWHRTHEQWGATQMQNRFRRESGRWMTPVDYQSWAAVRSIGEAITRAQTNEVQEVKNYLLSDSFGLGAYKGVKVSFRSWNGQLRQPILLASPRSMVSVSPQEGYIHPFSELDTLGKDKPESACKF
jgi:ABC transporter substrate binding protein (PQQ-dependent alcohol dehydrogenase system)